MSDAEALRRYYAELSDDALAEAHAEGPASYEPAAWAAIVAEVDARTLEQAPSPQPAAAGPAAQGNTVHRPPTDLGKRFERKKTYDHSADECYESLLDVYGDLGITITSQDPTRWQGRGSWRSPQDRFDRRVNFVCGSLDGKSTIVTVAYYGPLVEAPSFVSNVVEPFLDKILVALVVRLSGRAPERPGVMAALTAAEQAQEAAGPPACDECGAPASDGVECGWVVGKKLSEEYDPGSREVKKTWGEFAPVRTALCRTCFAQGMRSAARWKWGLLVGCFFADAAWVLLLNEITSRNVGEGTRGVLAIVTGILMVVTVLLVWAAWPLAGKDKQVSSLLLDYCRRKLPAGARYMIWTRRQFEEEARRRRWR